MFATVFTDINVKDIEISFCNYDNNNLIYWGKANDANLFPGLIHARFNDIVIDTFCFTHFRDSTNKGKIISRGTEWHNNTGDWNNYEQLTKITVKNCYADESVRGHIPNHELNNTTPHEKMFIGEVIIEENLLTLKISQLFLGACQGNVIPGDEIVKEELHEPSKAFTNSFIFTKSDYFSETGKFSKSSFFSKSNDFSKSSLFSDSNYYARSNIFSKSGDFSKTTDFSKSDLFTRSKYFSESKDFTESTVFSESNYFSSSVDFTNSKQFSHSTAFSGTGAFSETIDFTKS